MYSTSVVGAMAVQCSGRYGCICTVVEATGVYTVVGTMGVQCSGSYGVQCSVSYGCTV